MNYGTTIRKLTQPHLFTNNMFPPINAHSRPPSEDLRGLNHPSESPSGTKQQQQQPSGATVGATQIRRQQTLEQNRRSPLRIIYRSSDYAWNDHPPPPHQPLRAASPIKNKITTSARQLANGILHENSVPVSTTSMMHLPTSSSPTVGQQDHHNAGDYFLSSASKSRHANRLQRTNSHLDNKGIPTTFALPLRSDSYRSTNFDFGVRPRHTSSKQRSYVNSKASSHEMNNGEGYLSNGPDESPGPSSAVNNTTQRLNVSSFDLTTSRKSLSPNKSISFNGPVHHAYHTSTHELHRSDTTIDRNNLTRFALRGTVSKEHPMTLTTTTPAVGAAPLLSSTTTTAAAAKYRQTSSFPVTNTPGVVAGHSSASPAAHGERHPSAQSYKSRDPNVSYAYNDVKKYIEENELMSAEKEQIIRHWIMDVEKYRHQLTKIE